MNPATNGVRTGWPSWYGLLLLVLVAGALSSLAFWQWQRAAQKEHLLARQEARSHDMALDWDGLRRVGADISDRPVRLRGRFDPAYRVALDNQMRAGRAGYHLYVLFRPEAGGPAVLVNTGWLPTDRDGGPAVPAGAPVVGEITGWAAYPSRFITVGEPELTRGLWRAGRIDVADWSARWGVPLVPWVVRMSPEVPGGHVRDWRAGIDMRMGPERHRAYAFQWAALTVAWCICWFLGWRKLGGEGR